MRVAVAAEKSLQPHKLGCSRRADEHGPGPAFFNQAHAAENERAHDDLAQLSGADHEDAHMRRVQWHRRASFCASLPGGKGLAPRKLADLSRELTDAVARYRRLAIETIAAHDIDGAFQHKPSRGVAFAGIEHDLARFEDGHRAAREALCRFDLFSAKHGEHLVSAASDHGLSCLHICHSISAAS